VNYATRVVDLDESGAASVSVPPSRLASIMAKGSGDYTGTLTWSCERTGQAGSEGAVLEDAELAVDGAIAIQGDPNDSVVLHVRL
jgi:hypothetical protein